MKTCLLLLVAGLWAGTLPAAETFPQAASQAEKDLAAALLELGTLREQIKAEKLPMSEQLGKLEDQWSEVRREHEQVIRAFDTRNLDMNNLRIELKARQEEKSYLANLLDEYRRNFESRVHITELHRYQEVFGPARLAVENPNLKPAEVFAAQVKLVQASLKRLQEAVGGEKFAASAVADNGLVTPGTVVLVGPVAVYVSQDGQAVGLAEQRIGSLEPSVLSLPDPVLAEAARQLVANGRGQLPFDPTQGNALKIAATRETLVEHIQKGGPVMWPILGLAFGSLVVAVLKWVQIMRVRQPRAAEVEAILTAIEHGEDGKAQQLAGQLHGPFGAMLQAGTAHLNDSPVLVEELMYERLMETRLKLQGWLPFVAMCASAAPLFGLLGTVTGMINTFKLITVFGTGDPKTLSSGISEALITTEFGLITAIPALLLYAFLSRKARGTVDAMEKLAISLMNRLAKTNRPTAPAPAAAPSPTVGPDMNAAVVSPA